MSQTLFVRRGRKYVVFGHAQDWASSDTMRAGEWRMTYCYGDGSRRYNYGVRPDTASFVAACELAAKAMESAIAEKATAAPPVGMTPYTKEQMELIQKFRADMAAAGGLVPSYWYHSTARDIAQAGIDAVRKWRET